MVEESTAGLVVDGAEASSLVEEMRKTGTMNQVEKAERLEEIVQEAAQETRI